MEVSPGDTIAEAERRLILATVDWCDGNKRLAAVALDISLKTLYNKLNYYKANNMLKRDEIAQPGSCLNKAADDEPVFVLRAKDPLAAAAVEYWAKQAEASGLHDKPKSDDARQIASRMREWRDTNISRRQG